MTEVNRCPWADTNDKMKKYHDEEWGRPIYDDRKIFECLILEIFQAGLSWSTILNKREGFRKAFDNFDPNLVKDYGDVKIKELLNNDDIVKHEAKIIATIENANAYFNIKEKYGSFSKFIWSYVFDTPIINPWSNMSEVPSKSQLSDKVCEDMKKEGFKFIGSTTIHSFLQSIGIINDHLLSCDFKYD